MRSGRPAPGFAAGLGSFGSIGVGRFGFGPILPAMVLEGSLTPGQGGWVAAANFAGYLTGALAAGSWSGVRAGVVLNLAMLLVAASLFGAALPWGFAWLLVLRWIAGAAAGVVMVRGASAAREAAIEGQQGRAGGTAIAGVGPGIVASAFASPLLAWFGVAWARLFLGALAATSGIVARRGWPERVRVDSTSPSAAWTCRPSTTTLRIIAAYAASGLEIVPHMVFLPDHATRGLGAGAAWAAWIWVAFGVGGALGPIVAGRLVDRVGAARAVVGLFLLQLVAVLVPIVAADARVLLGSALLGGAAGLGMVSAALARTAEIAGPIGARASFASATVAYAATQAAGSPVFSALLTATGRHAALYPVAALITLIGLLIAPRGGARG